MLSSAHLTLKTQPGRPYSTAGSKGATAPSGAAMGASARSAAVQTTAPEPQLLPTPQSRGLGRIVAVVAILTVIGVGVVVVRGVGRMIASSQETTTVGAEKFRSALKDDSSGAVGQEVRANAASIREQGDRQLEEAVRLVQAGADDAAEAALKTFIEENPKHPRLADARFELLKIMWKQGRFSAAREELQGFRVKHPADPRTPEVRMMLGEANAELNEQDAAISELERVIQDHPSSPVVTRAMWRVAKAYEAKGDIETARKRYQAVLGRTGPSDDLYVKSAAALEQLPAPTQ